MTNTYVDLREDVINQLNDTNSNIKSAEDVKEYVESKGFNFDEFTLESKKAQEHEAKFREAEALGLSKKRLNLLAPGHLQKDYDTFQEKVIIKPIQAGVRSVVKGVGQLAEAVLPEAAEEFIGDKTKKVDDYLSNNPYTSRVYGVAKETFDPPTTKVQEVAGEIGSLITGTTAISKALTKSVPNLPKVVNRLASFTGAEVLVGNKDENFSNFLVTTFPETAKPLERLAINPDDPDALKVVKKAIDSAAVGGVFETAGLVIKGGIDLGKLVTSAIRGTQRTLKKDEAIKSGIGEPVKNVKVKETEIVEDPNTGKFIFKTILSQPIDILSDPKKGKMSTNFLSRFFTSKQGMDQKTYRAFTQKEGALKSLAIAAKGETKKFEKLIKKVYGKSYNELDDDELLVIKNALGKKPNLQDDATPEILKILDKPFKKRTKAEQKIIEQHYDNLIRKEKSISGSAYKELKPEMQLGVTRIRNIVDSLSEEIKNLGISKGLNTTIDKNAGLYLTEDFKAFTDPKYIKEVTKILKGGKATEGEAFEAVQLARRVIKQSYPKFSRDEIDGMLMNYINKKGIKDVDNLDILNLGSSKSIPQHVFGKVLTARKNIDPAFRAILGPIDDPLVRFNETTKKLGSLVVEHNFLKNIEKIAKSDYGVDLYKILPKGKEGAAPSATFSAELSDLANNYLRAFGDNANPLARVFTTPEFKKILQAGTELKPLGDDTSSALKAYYGLSGYVSGAKTSLSGVTHIKNFEGNFLLLLANGNLGLGVAKELPQAAMVLTKRTPQALDEVRDLTERGVLSSGVRAQFIIQSMDDAFKNTDNFAKKFYDKTIKVAGDVYSAEDDVMKAVAFYRELQRYSRAYPNATKEQLRGLAAEVVKNTMPTYNMIPRGIKQLRRMPIGAFPAFTAEIFRNTKEIIKIGASDILKGLPKVGSLEAGNPQLVRAGASRLAGLTTAFIAGQQYLQHQRKQFGIRLEDDEILRLVGAKWQKDEIREYISPIFKNPKTGKREVRYRNLTYTLPHAPIIQLGEKFFPFMFSLKSGNVDEIQKKLNDLLSASESSFAPFINESLLVEPLLDSFVRGGTTKEGKSLYKESDDYIKRRLADAFNIFKAFQPGTYTTYRSIRDSLNSETINNEIKKGLGTTDAGFPKRYEDQIASLSGFKHQTDDIDRSINIKVSGLTKKISSVDSELFSSLNKSFNVDWTNKDSTLNFYKELNNALATSYKRQQELAEFLHEVQKLEFYEKVDDNVIRKKVGDDIYSILTIQGTKEFPKKAMSTMLNSLGKNKIGVSKSPRINNLLLRLNKDQNIPGTNLKDIIKIIERYNNLPLLEIQETEQE
jgi:hypothetical protein